MNRVKVKRKAYRIPRSKYWGQYWHPRSIGMLATLQLILTFGILAMEIGNAAVDLFRANIYSGFWSFPFIIAAIVATYASVCMKRTQTKAFVALILQIISILVLFVVIGFLIAFIASSFTLCLGVQCSQSASTYYSPSTYTSLKAAFISCELAFSVIYIILSIIYIILYIKCYKKIPTVNPVVRSVPLQSAMGTRQLGTLSQVSRSWPQSASSYNPVDMSEQMRISTSSVTPYNGAQQVCPICKHVSPYITLGNIVQCPKCGYRSPYVEHAQQW